MPFFESFMPTGYLISVRFGRWDDVLKAPEPAPLPRPSRTPSGTGRAAWRWPARGRPREAEAALKSFIAKAAAIPPETGYGQNTTGAVFKIAEHFLNARLAAARGDRKAAR